MIVAYVNDVHPRRPRHQLTPNNPTEPSNQGRITNGTSTLNITNQQI